MGNIIGAFLEMCPEFKPGGYGSSGVKLAPDS